MSIHSFRLPNTLYTAIVSGHKVIESRLFDDKRQLIQLGDTIEFTNRQFPDQKVSVKVIGLLRYNTFHELFSHNDPSKFGGESVELLDQQIGEFYSPEDQARNGVLGIEFQKL